MKRFADRAEGARALAEKLQNLKGQADTIVLGLPRGGVVTAAVVAEELALPLDIIVARKIGAPMSPELAVGALTADGAVHLNKPLMKTLRVTEEDVAATIEAEREEAQRRQTTYRGDRLPLDMKNKVVVLVDDGIATGATVKAGVVAARKAGAKEVIVAVPVLPAETVNEMEAVADSVVYVMAPDDFMAVGQFYRDFPQVEDEEVIAIMEKSAR